MMKIRKDDAGKNAKAREQTETEKVLQNKTPKESLTEHQREVGLKELFKEMH